MGGRGSWAAAAVACVALALAGGAAAAHRDGGGPSAGGLATAARRLGPVSRPPRPTAYRLRWSRQARASRSLPSRGGFRGGEAGVGPPPGTNAAPRAPPPPDRRG